jgi:DUF4097 and DUF4098 domain-containing protein YvlB
MQTWEHSFDLPPGAGVNIEQRAGLVKVIGWDQSTVQVNASSPGNTAIEDRMAVEFGSGGLYLRVKRGPGLLFWSSDDRIDLELSVPFGTACQIESGSGVIEVMGTNGRLQAETGSGRVAVAGVAVCHVETGSGGVLIRQVNGDLEATTGSGTIEVETVNGNATLDTGSGSITARAINGDLHADTGSGRLVVARIFGRAELDSGSGHVEVHELNGPSLKVDTGGGGARLSAISVAELAVDASSGRVEVELATVYPNGRYEIETGSGGVTVAVPPDAGLTVSVEAPAGRIVHTGLNLQVRHADRGELEAELNGGGASLSIEAGSGGIELRPYSGGPAAEVAAAPFHPAVPAAPVPPAAPTLPDPPPAPEPPTPPPAPSRAEAQLREVIHKDAALENSEQIRRVLVMLESGKLTPDEAEEILRALDEEEAPA